MNRINNPISALYDPPVAFSYQNLSLALVGLMCIPSAPLQSNVIVDVSKMLLTFPAYSFTLIIKSRHAVDAESFKVKTHWEIYKNNYKTFTIFTINSLNFFLSTLAKHTLFSPNYPCLQIKSNFLSPFSSNQTQFCTLESSLATAKGNDKRWRRIVKMKFDHNLSRSNTNRHHLVVQVIFWTYARVSVRLIAARHGWICLSHEALCDRCLSHQELDSVVRRAACRTKRQVHPRLAASNCTKSMRQAPCRTKRQIHCNWLLIW